jgi:hypothetical protein
MGFFVALVGSCRYLWTAVPLALALLNGVAFLLRGIASAPPAATLTGNDATTMSFTAERVAEAAAKRFRQHVSVFLMGSYLVLPSLARTQLTALVCDPVTLEQPQGLRDRGHTWTTIRDTR